MSHNDFNYPNCLLLDEETRKNFKIGGIMLLDYEYVGKNFIYYDVANFIHSLHCVILPDPLRLKLIGRPHNQDLEILEKNESGKFLLKSEFDTESDCLEYLHYN